MLESPAYAEATVIGGGDVRHVSYGSDAGLYVEFSMEDVHQEAASEAAGRPIYKQTPFITIYVPGDKTKKVCRPVRLEAFGSTPSDVDRFPRQWAAFKAGTAQEMTGFPLKEWPGLATSQIKELNAVNVYTVEQLAEVPDSGLDTLGHGGRALRDKARAYLDRLNGDAATSRLEAQNADLQRQLDELRASLEQPRRGRPPKSEKDEEDAA